jgi:ferritin
MPSKRSSKKPAPKRNPQDTTLRNTRAANGRMDAIEEVCHKCVEQIRKVTKRVQDLEELARKNEDTDRSLREDVTHLEAEVAELKSKLETFPRDPAHSEN